MWQRWNQGTHIFEKSTDNGASWSPLGLNASIITEGTLPNERLSGNVLLNYIPNQVVQSAFRIDSTVQADLQLYNTTSSVMWRLMNYSDVFQIYDGGNQNLVLARDGRLTVRGGVADFMRGNVMGQRYAWAPLVLSSAGVNCGGGITAFYSIIGYQLWWSLYAVNIVVPAGGSPYMLVTLPPGYPPVIGFVDEPVIRGYIPTIADEPCYCQMDANYIQVYRMKATAWPAGTGHVIGQGFYYIG